MSETEKQLETLENGGQPVEEASAEAPVEEGGNIAPEEVAPVAEDAGVAPGGESVEEGGNTAA